MALRVSRQELKNKCNDCSILKLQFTNSKNKFLFVSCCVRDCSAVPTGAKDDEELAYRQAGTAGKPGAPQQGARSNVFKKLFLLYQLLLFPSISGLRTTSQNFRPALYQYVCGAFYAPNE